MKISCGVLLTDKKNLLLARVTGTSLATSPDGCRWDIPKGGQNPGESQIDAACREMLEETGVSLHPEDLISLGHYSYLSGKDLVLFACVMDPLPDTDSMKCTSYFEKKGLSFPEMDKFQYVPLDVETPYISETLRNTLRKAFPVLMSKL